MPGLQPFSFCMFILVDGVAATGWTRVFSGWYQAWVNVSGLAGCCFGIGVIGVILCNVRLCPSLSLSSPCRKRADDRLVNSSSSGPTSA
jgi:hypothetical protein